MGLLRTADVLRRRAGEVVEPFGVTLQQYNVLRILRGAGDEGLPTLAIPERMIEQTPGITRLIDRLVAKGLVRRTRVAGDRRRVQCRITPLGLDLLGRMDAAVEAFDERAVSPLTTSESETLTVLLERLRSALDPS